jgi:hypothetical protein
VTGIIRGSLFRAPAAAAARRLAAAVRVGCCGLMAPLSSLLLLLVFRPSNAAAPPPKAEPHPLPPPPLAELLGGATHNGGVPEALVPPVAGRRPHVLFVLVDDFGWADAGWHRPPGYKDVQTPVMNSMVAQGIELERHYTYKSALSAVSTITPLACDVVQLQSMPRYCSPTRCAIQSGRNPIHVNVVNANPGIANPTDPVGGYAGIARNMTGIATKLAAAGYFCAMLGKWDAGMASPDHTPRGRGYHFGLNCECLGPVY